MSKNSKLKSEWSKTEYSSIQPFWDAVNTKPSEANHQKLYSACLPIIKGIVDEASYRYGFDNPATDDFDSVANLAYAEALGKYEVTKNDSFAHYLAIKIGLDLKDSVRTYDKEVNKRSREDREMLTAISEIEKGACSELGSEEMLQQLLQREPYSDKKPSLVRKRFNGLYSEHSERQSLETPIKPDSEFTLGDFTTSNDLSPEDRALVEEDYSRVLEKMDLLSDVEKKIILAEAWEGLTRKEIEALTDLPQSTVSYKIRTARSKLALSEM